MSRHTNVEAAPVSRELTRYSEILSRYPAALYLQRANVAAHRYPTDEIAEELTAKVIYAEKRELRRAKHAAMVLRKGRGQQRMPYAHEVQRESADDALELGEVSWIEFGKREVPHIHELR